MFSIAVSAVRVGEVRVEGEFEKNVGGGLFLVLSFLRWDYTVVFLVVVL